MLFRPRFRLPTLRPVFGVRWAHSVVIPPFLSKRMDVLLGRHAQLSKELENGGEALGSSKFTALAKELAGLQVLAQLAATWKATEVKIDEAQQLMKECDPASADGKEMADLLNDDIKAAELLLQETKDALIDRLLPKDDADDLGSVVLEVRAGTGGDEAALFTSEMFSMYEKYAELKGWQFSILTLSKNSITQDEVAVRDATANIKGPDVFRRMKYESGVHRVQRVPVTEGGGRVHTSTMSVVVLPEPEEIDIELKPSDLIIDTHRATGAGGQHVNTTDSAVRITHIPTGIMVSIQEERSQHSNRARAMQLIRARVFDLQRQEAEKRRAEERRSQMGTADRSERIRTYNFAQNRITDHRSGLSKFGMDQMMAGELLDEFIDSMEKVDRDRRLADLEAEEAREAKSLSKKAK